MAIESNLQQFSSDFEACVAAHRDRVVAIRNTQRQHVSGIVWQPDVVVSSEQVFGAKDEYEIATTAARVVKARIVGRDSGTNVLVLRLDESIDVSAITPAEPRLGAIVMALAAGLEGDTQVRLGSVHDVGAQWFSRGGGRIDQRIGLDIRLRRTEEGGPVLDARGAVIGMSTLGRPGEVLAIPAATLGRIVPQLLASGHVARGWLGLALQPVAVPDALVPAAGQPVGMMVMSTIDEGPSAQAGIKAGDIVLTVNGTALRRRQGLAAQLSEDSVGKVVPLRLIRGGELLTVEVLVSTRP